MELGGSKSVVFCGSSTYKVFICLVVVADHESVASKPGKRIQALGAESSLGEFSSESSSH